MGPVEYSVVGFCVAISIYCVYAIIRAAMHSVTASRIDASCIDLNKTDSALRNQEGASANTKCDQLDD